MSASNGIHTKETVASRKIAAAELRKARKAARDPRNRLLSDSSDEVPKGILKNARIPTKRSVSECVDDLSQIMADLDLNIHDLPKATRKFCPHHQYFDEHEEDDDDFDDEDDENNNDENGEDDDDYDQDENIFNDRNEKSNDRNKESKVCDCNTGSGDSDSADRPKKSVRFDERVYETFFFASRLYDKRYIAKYHFSSRHHPPANQNGKKKRNRSKSESKDELSSGTISLKADNSCNKPTKSQRAKQSKKDKKKRLNKKEEVTDTGSDDQGYSSSMHSFSD